jgi:hypothetical protein
MDAIITSEEVTEFLKNPPSLAPRPDFNQLHALCQHIVTALKQLTCLQSPIHGWFGLAIDPCVYVLLEPRVFAEPPNPGATAVYPQFLPPARVKMIDATFTRDKDYFLSFLNINQTCFKMLDRTVSNQFKVSNTPNLTGWNSTMMICIILKQLEALYGKPDMMTLFRNDSLFQSPFPATKAPEMLFYRIEQCQEIQTLAQDPYSNTQIINNALRLLMQSNIFPLKEFDTWETITPKTYPALKMFIHEAYTCCLTAMQLWKFVHQSLCNPKILTLLKAVQKGFLKGCPNISEKLILKYLNPSPATAKGHLKRPRHGIRSRTPKANTRQASIRVPDITFPVPPAASVRSCLMQGSEQMSEQVVEHYAQPPNLVGNNEDESIANVFCFGAFADKNSGIIYRDLTGSFPFMLLDGSICFLVLYHCKSNCILGTPIAGLDDKSTFEA